MSPTTQQQESGARTSSAISMHRTIRLAIQWRLAIQVDGEGIEFKTVARGSGVAETGVGRQLLATVLEDRRQRGMPRVVWDQQFQPPAQTRLRGGAFDFGQQTVAQDRGLGEIARPAADRGRTLSEAEDLAWAALTFRRRRMGATTSRRPRPEADPPRRRRPAHGMSWRQ
jgi:hypothetical protein